MNSRLRLTLLELVVLLRDSAYTRIIHEHVVASHGQPCTRAHFNTTVVPALSSGGGMGSSGGCQIITTRQKVPHALAYPMHSHYHCSTNEPWHNLQVITPTCACAVPALQGARAPPRRRHYWCTGPNAKYPSSNSWYITRLPFPADDACQRSNSSIEMVLIAPVSALETKMR
jgi:hypothetical protein